MLQGIDHIVIVVSDLEQAAKDYEQLGFTVVPGGKHPVGSHNVLIALADGSYIEIIAFYREAHRPPLVGSAAKRRASGRFLHANKRSPRRYTETSRSRRRD